MTITAGRHPQNGSSASAMAKEQQALSEAAAQHKHGRIYAPGSMALMLASAWRPRTPNDQRE
jgi:hypothetical protein